MEHSDKDTSTYTIRPSLANKVVSKSLDHTSKRNNVAIQMTDGVLIPHKNDHHVFNSWRITFWLALSLLSILTIIINDPYRSIFFFIIRGLPTTFQVTILAILGAIIIGLFAGLGAVSKSRIVNMISGVYVEFIRGIPLLVQLIFIYYAMGRLFRIEGMAAAVAALSICFGAYMGEIIRAGIQAIPKGQMEAAIALGLSRGQAFRYVILPQTIKVVLPAIGNEFISMLKDSSLVSAIALSDILRKGREYISRTFLSLETMLIVALVYLVITLVLSRLVGILEERLHRHG